MSDPHDLQRFVQAQGPIYSEVLAELAQDTKRTHWMWFVFPQLRGLGKSETATRYGIATRSEAIAYHAHPVLGARLKECTALTLAVRGKTALDLFGAPDHLKFHSCVTLFAEVAPEEAVFQHALVKYFSGIEDFKTLELLGR